MSKFSKSSAGSTQVKNYMGGVAYKQSPKEELAFAVMTSFIENSYYEKADKRIDRISKLVEAVSETDPLFVAKLAVVTRREFHMRSSSQALLAELAQVHKGDSLVKRAIVELAERPDDLTEIVAYLKKPLPNAVKKGVAEALTKFDAYQLAKYRGEGKTVSLVDLFNLVHPKTADKELEKVWGKLMAGELKNSETWESKLSAGGDKKEVFGELLDKKKLGYMATLRNLRNILDTGDKELVLKAAALISDPEQVKKSKQLPFRFLSAFEAIGVKKTGRGLTFEKEVDGAEVLRDALVKALTVSCQNIPLLHGKTAILTDNSGSMRGDYGGSSALSAYSSRTTANIANLFATMYWLRADNTYVGVFGDRLEQPKLDREKDLFYNYEVIDKVGGGIGGGTERGVFEAFRELIANKQMVDRIIIFSDSQVGEGCAWYGTGYGERGSDLNKLMEQYRAINPSVMVYSIDLKGYGNAMFKDNTIKLTGWSDKLFELMDMVEKKEGLVKWIENYPVQL